MRIGEVRHRMTEDDWNRYRPASVAGYGLVDTVAVFPDRAVYRAAPESGDAGSRFVWLFDTDDATLETRVNRFLEAMFFDHPNLLRVFAAGPVEDSEIRLIFAVTEPFDYALSAAEPPRPLSLDALRPLVNPICAGLAWLHSQNLVYCALRGDSVVRVGDEWKLGDFSELRVTGRAATDETRRLMIRRDLYVPPEAYEGVVSPAWDAWSLGMLIQNLYAREARAMGRNPRTVPASAAELIRELGDTDPAQRLSVEAFAERLSNARQEVTPVAPEPEPQPIAPLPEIPETIESPDMRGQRIRILAAVALAFAAVVILALMYGHPAQNGTRRAPQRAASSAVATVTPAPAAAVANKPGPFDQPTPAEEKRDISSLLDRWVESTRDRNVAMQAACYAPVVRQFFGRRDVTVDQVKRAKERAFGEVGPAREFSIRDLRFDQVAPDRAVVSFVKSWDFPERHFAGSTREEMVMRRIGGAWKISSERELNQSAARAEKGTSKLPGPATNDPDSILNGETAGGAHAGNQ